MYPCRHGFTVCRRQLDVAAQTDTLKVLRWEERDKHLVIKEAQMVA